MRKIQRILVAIKSPGERWSPAVAKATQIARALGAHLELFHGVDTRLYVEALDTYEGGMAGFEALQSEPYARRLEVLAAKVRRHGVQTSCTTSIDYPIFEAILRRAEQTQADLIVTDGHTGRHIAPSLWRFTDWELMRLSPLPVLVVKRNELYRHPNIVAALDPTHAFAKPAQLDFEVLDLSEAFSVALKARLHAIHAFSPSAAAVHTQAGPSAGAAIQTDRSARHEAKASLDAVLTGRTIAKADRHVLSGHPTDALERGVSELGADILVLGCISRTGVRRLLMGNTAEQLIYRVPCDLLMVKPPGFASHIEHERRGPRLVATPACN